MIVNTRLFGEIDIREEKIITLEGGLIGFPDMQKFTIIFDEDKPSKNGIMWFQSLDEPQFAMPVIDPNLILDSYNPMVNDELLAPLGELTDDNLYVLVTIKVPSDLTLMTVNLKGPLVINADTLKGAQVIVEDDLSVRYPIYEVLQNKRREAGE